MASVANVFAAIGSLFEIVASFSRLGIASNDPMDLLSGSNAIMALMNENKRSIPALNLLMSVKELTTRDKSFKMWPNAELAWEMTPSSTLPAKYSGATTTIGRIQLV